MTPSRSRTAIWLKPRPSVGAARSPEKYRARASSDTVKNRKAPPPRISHRTRLGRRSAIFAPASFALGLLVEPRDRSQLVAQALAHRGMTGVRRGRVGGELQPRLVLLHGLQAQPDLLLLEVELDDPHLDLLAHGEERGRLLDVLFVQLRDVAETLDPFLQLDEGAEVGYAHDPAAHDVAQVVAREPIFPAVRLELLDPERELLVRRVDAEDHGLHLVPLLEHLRGMLDPLGPGHVRD